MQADMLREQLSATVQGYVTLEVPPRPAADLRTPEALARAADEVPHLEAVRRSTGRSLAALYAEILGAAVVAPDAAHKNAEALAAAWRLLFSDDSGRVPTRAYRNYLKYKQAFDAARAAGRDAQAEWTALQTAQPGRIEAALATLSQNSQADLGAAFVAARVSLLAGQREGADGPYHICKATPANFWEPEPQQHVTSSAQDRPLMRVMLDRPWLHLALLSRDGWAVPGQQAGAYSNGRADDSNTGLLALVPVAFFVAWTEGGAAEIVAWENLVLPPCPLRGSSP